LVYESGQCSRAQFTALSADQQRELITKMPDLKITDLVNATSIQMKSKEPNATYVTEEKFIKGDASLKLQVLNNPSKYIVVQNADQVPHSQNERISSGEGVYRDKPIDNTSVK
jgi:hypothetical protein